MNKIVKIFPVNSTFFRFQITDSEIYNKIVDRFSYELPVFLQTKYSTKKLTIIKANCLLYVGLINDFIEFLEQNEIEYKLEGKIIEKERIEDETLQRFITKLNLFLELYPHQFQAVKSVIENKRRTVLSPTSSGKSLIIAILFGFFLAMRKDPKKKLLLVVPNKLLVNQMYSDMMLYFQKSPFDIKNFIQPIHSEIKNRDMTKPIIITTWQSQKGTNFKFTDCFNESFMENVEMIIYDEVHFSTATESKQVIESAINAKYKVGLTGTLYDDNEYKNTVIQGMFGEIVSFITTREMIDMGIASDIDIHQIRLKRNYTLPEGSGYNEELEYVRGSQKYLDYVVNFVGKNCSGGNTLILHRSIQFGKDIVNTIKRLYPKKVVYVINGSVPAIEREKIRKKLNNENGVIVVATFYTVGTGVSINNLHFGVFVEGMKSNIRVIQAIGRMLRKFASKSKAVLFDFVPCLRIDMAKGSRKGTLIDHADRRVVHYENEQHFFKIHEFDFDF